MLDLPCHLHNIANQWFCNSQHTLILGAHLLLVVCNWNVGKGRQLTLCLWYYCRRSNLFVQNQGTIYLLLIIIFVCVNKNIDDILYYNIVVKADCQITKINPSTLFQPYDIVLCTFINFFTGIIHCYRNQSECPVCSDGAWWSPWILWGWSNSSERHLLDWQVAAAVCWCLHWTEHWRENELVPVIRPCQEYQLDLDTLHCSCSFCTCFSTSSAAVIESIHIHMRKKQAVCDDLYLLH
jgi:hypothetical protein